jgi:hypothetical protein
MKPTDRVPRDKQAPVLRLLYGDVEIAQSRAELVAALTRARAISRHLTRDGELDDWIQDDAERMAVAGETGPVMIDVAPPDMVAIEVEARAAYDAEIERHRQYERPTKKAPRPVARRVERPREHRSGQTRTSRGSPADDDPHDQPADGSQSQLVGRGEDSDTPRITVPPGWTNVQAAWFVGRLLLGDEARLHWHLAALNERRGDILEFGRTEAL